jgi:PAS domain S-box-containing protein
MSNEKKTKHTTPMARLTPTSILETLPQALFFVDDATTILYGNARAQTMIGTTSEELCGNSFWHCAPQLVSTSLYQAMSKAKQTRALTNVQYVSSLTRTWLHVQISPTLGGLMLQFHEESELAQRPQTFRPNEHLGVELLDRLQGAISFLTPEGIVLEINEAALEEIQARREEIVGKPLAKSLWWSLSPASQEQLDTAIARASKGEMVCFEMLFHSREGQPLNLKATITPHMGADHSIEYLVIAWIGRTVRQLAEANIYALIDAIPQLVWTGRPDGSIDYYNQRWLDYTGATAEQAQEDGWMQCTHPGDRQRVLEVWQHAVQTGRPYETEQRLRHGATGDYRWFLTQAVPSKDGQGTILKYVGTCTDIEEQKQVEERLKTSEQNWHILAETMPQLVWTMWPDGRLDYTNQHYRDVTQANFNLVGDDIWRQFVHPEDIEHTLMLRHHLLKNGGIYDNKYRIMDGRTGTYRWYLSRARSVRDEAGQIVKWFGTGTDIHEKKQAEDEIRVMIDTIPQLVWMMYSDGSCEYANQRWCDYTGMTVEQAQGDGWVQCVHPDDRQHVPERWLRSVQTGRPYEEEQRIRHRETGEYRWFLVRGMPLRDGQGVIQKWFGTGTDIDERKQMEEALRQSQERAQALMESNIIGIFIAEGDEGTIVDANDAFLRMTGYSREDLHQRTMNYVHMTPPEYQAISQQMHQNLLQHQSMMSYEKEYICKDGSRLPVLVGGVILTQHPTLGIIFVLDNSARKELEQRKDTFISMASHELKNPLTVLKLQTSILQKQLAKQGPPTASLALSKMETQLNKITRLVEELLDVSKIQAGRLEYRQEPVDLDVLLQEVVETMQQTCTTHTLVVRGIVQTSLLGDRDRLGQVFTNLLSNAIKYSPDVKQVEMDLSTSRETVTIRVHDHGLGIPQEQREKIFERFYRAVSPQQRTISGLGMGLYIVSEIVKHHEGTITVESAMGKGSTFTVTFPRKRDN